MRWRSIAIRSVLLLLLGVAALYAAAPYLLVQVATWRLEEADVAVESLAIGRPGVAGIRATDIRLRRDGAEVVVEHVHVGYRLGGLLGGRVDSVVIGAARVRIAGGGGGVPPVPFFRPPEQWPVGRLVLEGVEVFQGEAGAPRWRIEGHAVTAGPRIDGEFTVSGLAGMPLRIPIATDADGGVGFALAEEEGQGRLLEGRLHRAGDDVALELTLDGGLRRLAGLAGPWTGGFAVPEGWTGRARLDASLRAPAEAPDSVLARGSGRAELHLALDAGEAGRGRADGHAVLEDGAVDWRVEAGSGGWARVPGTGVPAPLREAVAAMPQGVLRLTVADALAGRLKVDEAALPEAVPAQGTLEARFGGEDGPLALTVRAERPVLTLADGPGISAGLAVSGRWDGAPVPWRRLTVEARGRLEHAPEATRLVLEKAGRARVSGGGPAWLQGGPLALELAEPADLVLRDRMVTADAPVRLAVSGGGKGRPLRLDLEAQEPTLSLDDGPRFTAGLGLQGEWTGAPLPWRRVSAVGSGRLDHTPEQTRVTLDAGTRAEAAEGGPAVMKEGAVAASLEEAAALVARDGSVAADGPVALAVSLPPATGGKWRLEPGKARVRLREAGAAGDAWAVEGSVKLPVRRGGVAGQALPAGRVEADVRAASGEPVTANYRLRSEAAGLALDGEAHHALDSGKGGTTFRLKPLVFGPDDRRLGARLPGWDRPFDLDGGEARAEGLASWGGEAGLRAQMDVALHGLAGWYGTVRFEGATADLPLRWGPEGPSTAGPAPVRVARVRAGVPVEGVELEASVAPGPELALRDIRAALLGGRVTSAAVTVGPDLTGRFTVEVSGVEMARLVALEGREGLEAEGTLDGTLPVRFSPEGVTVEGGALRARPPGGVIRFQPPGGAGPMAAAHPQMELVLKAVRNLQYHTLDADVDYAEDGTLKLKVALRGTSPEVSRERPLHLNLNIEEDIPALLRSLRMAKEVGGRLEAGILKRLEKK